jgi:hypothetical protein
MPRPDGPRRGACGGGKPAAKAKRHGVAADRTADRTGALTPAVQDGGMDIGRASRLMAGRVQVADTAAGERVRDPDGLRKALESPAEAIRIPSDFAGWDGADGSTAPSYYRFLRHQNDIWQCQRVYHPGACTLDGDLNEELCQYVLNGHRVSFELDARKQSAIRYCELFLATVYHRAEEARAAHRPMAAEMVRTTDWSVADGIGPTLLPVAVCSRLHWRIEPSGGGGQDPRRDLVLPLASGQWPRRCGAYPCVAKRTQGRVARHRTRLCCSIVGLLGETCRASGKCSLRD